MKDQYISVLGETVVKLETVYGMKNAVDGTRISDMSMRDIVQYYNEVIRTQSKEALVSKWQTLCINNGHSFYFE